MGLLDEFKKYFALKGETLGKTEIVSLVREESSVPIALKPTDPAPTVKGVYEPTVDGTYANAGGLKRETGPGGADEGKYVKFFFDGVKWEKNSVPLPSVPIAQAVGESTTSVMSQKAVTDKLNKYEEVYSEVPMLSESYDVLLLTSGVTSSALPQVANQHSKIYDIADLPGPFKATGRAANSATYAGVGFFDNADNFLGFKFPGPQVNFIDEVVVKPDGATKIWVQGSVTPSFPSPGLTALNSNFISQEPGVSATKIMSQKAVTDYVDNKPVSLTKWELKEPTIVYANSHIANNGDVVFTAGSTRQVNEYAGLSGNEFEVSGRTFSTGLSVASYDVNGSLTQSFIPWSNPASNFIRQKISVPIGTVMVRVYGATTSTGQLPELRALSSNTIVQGKGAAPDKIMSQASVTNELNKVSTLSFGDTYASSLNIPIYPTYERLIEEYDKLIVLDSTNITKNSLGVTDSGYTIWEYVFSSGNYNSRGARGREPEVAKPKILIQGGIHGNERGSIISPLIVMRQFAEALPTLSKLRNFEIRVMPCLNAWGYSNNRRWNHNLVDLNRNYASANWEFGGEGTSNYSGPTPASEAETQISQTWMNAHLDAITIIDFHNSYLGTEVSCMANAGKDPLYSRTYLTSMEGIYSMLVTHRGMKRDNIMAYELSSSVNGSFSSYVGEIAVNTGGTLETPTKLDFVDGTPPYDERTLAAGADVLGNILLGLEQSYNISKL